MRDRNTRFKYSSLFALGITAVVLIILLITQLYIRASWDKWVNRGPTIELSSDIDIFKANPPREIRAFRHAERMIGIADNWSPYIFNMTGKLIWSLGASHPDDTCVSTSIDQAGNLYFGTTRGLVYSYDVQGRERWTYDTGTGLACSPSLGPDSYIFIACPGKLIALKPNLEVFWQAEVNSVNEWFPPAFDVDGQVYISIDNDGLRCLSFEGEELWETGPSQLAAHAHLKSYAYSNGSMLFFDCVHKHAVCYCDQGLKQWEYGSYAPSSGEGVLPGDLYPAPVITSIEALIFIDSDMRGPAPVDVINCIAPSGRLYWSHKSDHLGWKFNCDRFGNTWILDTNISPNQKGQSLFVLDRQGEELSEFIVPSYSIFNPVFVQRGEIYVIGHDNKMFSYEYRPYLVYL